MKHWTSLICVLGCWACMIYAAATYGLRAGAIVAIAMTLQAIDMAMRQNKEEESKPGFLEGYKLHEELLNSMEDDGK